MTKNISRRFVLKASAAMAVAGSLNMPRTASAADFSGKEITFWTSHNGADSVLSLQTFSNHIAKYMPGNPKITVVSKFGGGGLVNANYFAAINKPDGMDATMFNFVVTMAWGMKRDGVNYELDKYKMIGAEPQVFMFVAGPSAKVGENLLDIANSGQHTLGTRTRNGNTMAAEVLFNEAGNPLKVVTGFGSTEEVIQSLASGELQLSYIYGPAWVRNEENYRSLGLQPLAQMGVIDEGGEIVRYGLLPEIPTVAELLLQVKPDAKSSQAYRSLKVATGLSNIGKGYFIGADTPDDIVEAWRTAMVKAAADPEFIAEHTQLLGYELELVPGPQATEVLADGLETLADPFFQKDGAGYDMIWGG